MFKLNDTADYFLLIDEEGEEILGSG